MEGLLSTGPTPSSFYNIIKHYMKSRTVIPVLCANIDLSKAGVCSCVCREKHTSSAGSRGPLNKLTGLCSDKQLKGLGWGTKQFDKI